MSEKFSRRDFLKKSAVGSAGSIAAFNLLNSWSTFAQDLPEVDWNAPKPMDERVGARKWVPPEGTEEIAEKLGGKEIDVFNFGSMKYDPATKENQKVFRERTGINVVPVPISSHGASTKMTTVLAGRKPSPVMMQTDYTYYMMFVAPGWLEPLDEIWEGPVVEQFSQDILNKYRTDIDSAREGEHIYFTPAVPEVFTFHYRPSLLEREGFDPDKFKDATWDDVVEVCEAFKDKPEFGYAWRGAANRFGASDFVQRIWCYGGQVLQPDGRVVVNSDEGIASLEWQVNLLKNKLAPDVATISHGDVADLYLAGKLVTCSLDCSMGWEAKEKFDTGMGLVPKETTRKHWFDIDATVINTNAPDLQKLAAKIYCDFRRSAEATANELVIEGNTTTNLKAYEFPEVKAVDFAETIEEANRNADIMLIPSQLEIFEELTQQLNAAYKGSKSPEQALEDAQKFIDGVLLQ